MPCYDEKTLPQISQEQSSAINGNGMKNLTESQLKEAIATCCVSKQTIQSRRNELHTVKQDSGAISPKLPRSPEYERKTVQS